MTARTELRIPQGTTWSQSWKVTGYDLTDATWQARSQVRCHARSDEVLHDFTATLAGDVVTVAVDPDESSVWSWRDGVYDVEIHSDDGRVLRVAQGTVSVSPEVTRDG